MVPIKNRSDKQLVSYNEQNSVYTYKYTFSVQIVPICKEDLCLLPMKVRPRGGARRAVGRRISQPRGGSTRPVVPRASASAAAGSRRAGDEAAAIPRGSQRRLDAAASGLKSNRRGWTWSLPPRVAAREFRC